MTVIERRTPVRCVHCKKLLYKVDAVEADHEITEWGEHWGWAHPACQQLRGAVTEIRESLELLDPEFDGGGRDESDITAAREQLERLASRLDGGQ